MSTDSQRAPTVRLSKPVPESSTAVEIKQHERPDEQPLSEDPLIGTVVSGRYRVLARLGEGGMGAVYRVEHTGLKKHYALKVLRLQSVDGESVARFEREALAAAHLEHKNIARCIDVGPIGDGGRFLVMELVEGEPLSATLSRDGALAPARALPILSQVASALASAHGREVVHRDLKPDNIIVGRDGVVKLIDFGIARARSHLFGGGGGTALTKAGTMLGTPAYMSPEQVVGQTVDARADQYAFGVIAFEMLTGRPPFAAEDALALVFKHVGEEVPRASQCHPSLPTAIDAVFDRIMAKTPEGRFATVQQAYEAIAAALRGDSTVPLSSSVAMAPAASATPSNPFIVRGPVTQPQAVAPLASSAAIVPAAQTATDPSRRGHARKSLALWAVAALAVAALFVVGAAIGLRERERSTALELPAARPEPRRAVADPRGDFNVRDREDERAREREAAQDRALEGMREPEREDRERERDRGRREKRGRGRGRWPGWVPF